MLSRRLFLQSGLAAPAAAYAADSAPSWGGPVIDIHHHLRQQPGGDLRHMEGCGVTHAVLLTRVASDAQAKALADQHPKRFVRFSSTDTSKADAAEILRRSVMGGAVGMGELKSHVAADGPEMRRIYDLAAELGVPVLIHFGEFEQYPGEGTFNTGLQRFPALLKAYPKVTFIGHADFFWANISAEVPKDTPYPKGPVKKGGLTGKLLADFPNLYGDLSANSGRNALARDPDFSAEFLTRHQDKLMFGSDCSCSDGRGAGQRSTQPLVAGKCVARETLTALKSLTKPEVFRKLTFTNAARMMKMSA